MKLHECMNCSTCGIVVCATLVHKNAHKRVSANAHTEREREEGGVQTSREGTEKFGIS